MSLGQAVPRVVSQQVENPRTRDLAPSPPAKLEGLDNWAVGYRCECVLRVAPLQKHNEARRFITLVDVLYETRTR